MKHLTLLSLISLGAASLGSAAVITPTPGSVVDPTGAETVDSVASGSATLATFNAQSGLNVIQDWSGASGGTDVINLSGVDIRITTSFSSLYTDGRDTSASFQTSTSAQNFAWAGTNGQTITIEFGTWNGSTFIADETVQSAGLTFLNFGGAYDTASDQTIVYRDASLSTLSTQVFAGASSDTTTTGGFDFFSGYISGSQNIASIQIAITRSSGNSDIAIDDLAFAVPEPSTYAIFAGLLALGLAIVRRRMRS
jgi:hypothetical protein